MRCERGQATVEWTGLVLLVALVLSAMVAVVPAVDGRSLGSYLAHSIVCAVRGGCSDGRAWLARAYSPDGAAKDFFQGFFETAVAPGEAR